jgi:uncharacterized protein (DUF58 family)
VPPTAAAALRLARNWTRRHVRYRITRSGFLFLAALILVAAAAVASANNLLFLILAAMLAALMISSVVSRLSLAGLELELLLPEHIAARQPVTARLRLRNLKWFASFAVRLAGTEDAAPSVLQREIAFPTVPARATIEVSAPALFPRRGPHRNNLFLLSTRFPFGFMERFSRVSIRSEVVVYPALEDSLLGEELLGGLRGELDREQRGVGSDFYRLRPYELHESARHLDWKSSARTARLQIREFAGEERSAVYLFFDLQGQAGEPFERAIECCASLVWRLSRESARIRFRTQAVDLVFPDQVDVYRILEALALAEPLPVSGLPAPDEADPHVLFSESPGAFEAAGWQPGRIVSPSELP